LLTCDHGDAESLIIVTLGWSDDSQPSLLL
jgi:hypothetical protein